MDAPMTTGPKRARGKRRARRGTGHVFLRGSIWWLKYYVNGKPQAESSGSQKVSVAQDLLTERLGQIQRKEPVLPRRSHKVMFPEAAEDLRVFYKTHGTRKLGELDSRLGALKAFFEHYCLAAIDTPAVERYIAHRLEQGRAGASINRETTTLRLALRL